MSLTRAEIRTLVSDTLKAGVQSLAGAVTLSRADPERAVMDRFPCAIVYADQVRRTSLSRGAGAPTFRCVVSVTVLLHAEGAEEGAADDALDDLAEATLAVLLEDPAFVAQFEEITEVSCLRERRANGDSILAREAITFDLQLTETFEPSGLAALVAVRMSLDAIDPADPTGSYPAIGDFPPPKNPPRTQGPDGRAEAETRITLPQP